MGMGDKDIIKALDILDKFDFFGGQRAGRELWFDKPANVQDEDIKRFSEEVAFLKDFITRLKAENEEQDRAIINALHHMKVVRAEAIKEFAVRLRNKFFNYYDGLTENTSKSNHNGDSLMFYEVTDMIVDCIDNTMKEMTEGEDEAC